MKFDVQPRQVEVMGLQERRVDESLVVTVTGGKNQLMPLRFEPTLEEAVDLVGKLVAGLEELGYDVTPVEVPESTGRRRGRK